MAQYYSRLNLTAANIPFLTENWGRTVIVPQYDQNFDYSVSSPASLDRDKGLPQIFYAHNTMPTSYGMQSVSYRQVLPGFAAGSPYNFDDAIGIQTLSLQRVIYSYCNGKNMIYDANVGHWAQMNPVIPVAPIGAFTTTAFLGGETYIYVEEAGCMKYDPVGQIMVGVTLISLSPSNVLGICEANGYMIAWSSNSVSWSGINGNILDFTPSLVTGANGGVVQDAKGFIVACLPIAGGFLVYCEFNIVAAKYSGNVNFPFIFTEVPGSAGIRGPQQVSYTSNLAEHYAWTTSGLMKVDKTSATLVFPEVTDFLTSQLYETFNETSLELTQTHLAKPVDVKINVIEDRYIVISYGPVENSYEYALVFDNALKRWGKLKLNHVACFQWNYPNLTSDLIRTLNDKQDFGFLQSNGTGFLVNFSLDFNQLDPNNGTGVVIIGKYQLTRAMFLTHLSTDVETVVADNEFNYYLYPTLDGKTFLPAVSTFLSNTNPTSRTFKAKVTGQNISGLLVGNYNLSSIILNFTTGGNR